MKYELKLEESIYFFLLENGYRSPRLHEVCIQERYALNPTKQNIQTSKAHNKSNKFICKIQKKKKRGGFFYLNSCKCKIVGIPLCKPIVPNYCRNSELRNKSLERERDKTITQRPCHLRSMPSIHRPPCIPLT